MKEWRPRITLFVYTGLVCFVTDYYFQRNEIFNHPWGEKPWCVPRTPHFTWKGKKCRMKGWTTHWGWIFTPFLSLPTTLLISELVGTSRCNSPRLIVGTISICYLFKWAKWVIVSGRNCWEHKESSAVLISGWNLLVERSCLQRARRVALRIQMSRSATQITQPWPDLRSTIHSSFLVCFLNIVSKIMIAHGVALTFLGMLKIFS